jgi:hypothetical protein
VDGAGLMGDSTEDTAVALGRLRERDAINGLLLLYCELVDGNRQADVLNLFTEDATYDHGHGRVFTGRAELASLFAQLDLNDATSHHLSNVHIELEPGQAGRASSRSYVYAYHRRTGSGQVVQLWGRYHDSLVKREVCGSSGTAPCWRARRQAWHRTPGGPPVTNSLRGRGAKSATVLDTGFRVGQTSRDIGDSVAALEPVSSPGTPLALRHVGAHFQALCTSIGQQATARETYDAIRTSPAIQERS